MKQFSKTLSCLLVASAFCLLAACNDKPARRVPHEVPPPPVRDKNSVNQPDSDEVSDPRENDRFLNHVIVGAAADTRLVSCLCDQLTDTAEARAEFYQSSRCESEPLRAIDDQTLQLRLVVRDREGPSLQDSHVIYLDSDLGWSDKVTYFGAERIERNSLLVTQSDETLYRQLDLMPCAKYLEFQK